MKNDMLTYHLDTSYSRSKMEGHPLDWDHQPDVYKRYPIKKYMNFPEPVFSGTADIVTLSENRAKKKDVSELTVERLSTILSLGFGITGVAAFKGKDFYYRSMPSAGALYPNEVYILVHSIKGIDPGLYHYQILDRSLTQLRSGTYNDALESVDGQRFSETIGASLIISGIFFRTTWKYRKRGYRYILNDTGHLVENLYLASLYEGIQPIVNYDFDDSKLNRLIGLNSIRSIENLVISSNDTLTSLTGLENVTSIHSLLIGNNNELTSIESLNNLSGTLDGALFIAFNRALVHLEGLNNLTSIGQDLWIYENPNILTLEALSNIVTVGGRFTISGNLSLESLGFDALYSIHSSPSVIGTAFKISNNSSLCTDRAQALLDQLDARGGIVVGDGDMARDISGNRECP